MSINVVQLSGRLTKDAEYVRHGDVYLESFTVAVDVVQWNSETRQREIQPGFFAAQRWLKDIGDDMVLYRGDLVYLVGELSQYRKEEGALPHTRISIETVVVTRPGKNRPAPVSAARPARDPWSTPNTEEPPF